MERTETTQSSPAPKAGEPAALKPYIIPRFSHPFLCPTRTARALLSRVGLISRCGLSGLGSVANTV